MQAVYSRVNEQNIQEAAPDGFRPGSLSMGRSVPPWSPLTVFIILTSLLKISTICFH